MFVIVDIQGQQIKVHEGQEVFVNRLPANEGENVTFKDVKLFNKDGKTKIGAPNLSRAKVEATVLEHLKGDKVLVFKKKRRKGYQKLNGHRQALTKLKIETIKA